MIRDDFWKGKKVLITGHTGFKGSWLSVWLKKLGAEITGYSLEPATTPNLFDSLKIKESINNIYGDIRDRAKLKDTIEKYKPEIVFHLAAQPIVTSSYLDPLETLDVNIMGTANLFDIVRNCEYVKVIINVTSDKCYENKEQVWGYRESEPMGGYDPYSCSKACSELLTNSFRNSYYNEKEIMLASARAGNVIGGGDWATDRLVPDIVRGLSQGEIPIIRSPHAIRPWQHVLEPLHGYMILAQKLWEKDKSFAEGWNFGPEESNIINVRELVEKIMISWCGSFQDQDIQKDEKQLHEAKILKLDSSKAKYKLNWSQKLDIDKTIEWTVDWYKSFYNGKDMQRFTLNQIQKYEAIRR